MGKKHDAKKALSKVSGLSEGKVDLIWQEVRENHKKLDGCKVHNFGEIQYAVHGRYECKNCGGIMTHLHMQMYTKGYVAAGKNKEDIYVLKGEGED